MKMLIPTDFSANARHALNYAALLAKTMKARLILLHVYTPPVTRENIAYQIITQEIGSMLSDAKEKLQAIASAITDEYGIDCDQLVRMGNPVSEVVQEAETNQVDFIVMGTLGASGLSKIIFGSNTTSVMERATCPVLAVPANSSLALPAKIVFATNFEDNDLQTVKVLANITRSLKAELILLHVSKDNLQSDHDLIENFSKAVANEVNMDQPFYYVLHHENTQAGIDHFIDSVEADLLAVSMRKRSLFERIVAPSLSKKIAYQARLPLLVFHTVETESNDHDV
jgi:nucleotide-binding universal stress UspA family protein